MPEQLPAPRTLSNIASAIRLAVIRFQYQLNAAPNVIYLGRRENALLDALINETGFTMPDPYGTKRRQWEGREVFVVDAVDHLAVGILE